MFSVLPTYFFLPTCTYLPTSTFLLVSTYVYLPSYFYLPSCTYLCVPTFLLVPTYVYLPSFLYLLTCTYPLVHTYWPRWKFCLKSFKSVKNIIMTNSIKIWAFIWRGHFTRCIFGQLVVFTFILRQYEFESSWSF